MEQVIERGITNLLRASLGQERSEVAIDLNEVVLLDREAIQLLAFRESNGSELRNCKSISVNGS